MKKLLLFLLILLGGLVLVGLFLPSERHVERTITVERPPATVYALLNGFHSFNEWSPWARLDPDAEYLISGPASGVGARMAWSGDPALVGTGSQEIIAVVPDKRVEVRLDFGPQGTAVSYYDIEPVEQGSRLNWGFDTDVTEGQGFVGGLLGRYFGLMLDRWVGADYEQGLADFKAYAEGLPAADFSGAEIELVEVEPVPVLVVSGESAQDSADIANALASAYGQIMAVVNEQGLEVNGQPMAITRAWEAGAYRFDAAIPVIEPANFTVTGPVRLERSPGGRAARLVHVGPYTGTAAAYAALAAWMAAHGYAQGEVSWEHYISDPGDTPEAEIITHIYYAVAAEDS